MILTMEASYCPVPPSHPVTRLAGTAQQYYKSPAVELNHTSPALDQLSQQQPCHVRAFTRFSSERPMMDMEQFANARTHR